MIARTREAVTALVNGRNAHEIAFGLNATSFIRSISLAVGQSLGARRDVIVTELDHEANVATWVDLQRFGARILWWKVRQDGALHVEDLASLMTDRTRLVACTVASNAIGTRVDARRVGEVAHDAGAEVFLDAVHLGPHGSIDVQALDCDYLVCSGYKIFSPHMGFAWCRPEAINALPMFREDFIPDVTPDKLEAGTYAYENVAGMEAVVGYLERLGHRLGADPQSPRSAVVRTAMDAITTHEQSLSAALIDAVLSVDGAKIHGISDQNRLSDRVPTVSFTVEGIAPSAIGAELARRGVGVRSGHMYAPRLMERLQVGAGGVVRASLAHYNTLAEIARFHEALADVVTSLRPTGGRVVTPTAGRR